MEGIEKTMYAISFAWQIKPYLKGFLEGCDLVFFD